MLPFARTKDKKFCFGIDNCHRRVEQGTFLPPCDSNSISSPATAGMTMITELALPGLFPSTSSKNSGIFTAQFLFAANLQHFTRTPKFPFRGKLLQQDFRNPSRKPFFRCTVTKESTISPAKVGEESSNQLFDCVVVGAGISGLSIALALKTKHGETVGKVLVTEAVGRVGGNITTVERDGYLWEEGPNSFQPSDPMLTTVVDSGLKDDLVLGDPNAPRFILWGGKLRPVPSKPTDLPFFDLMSFGGKLRAGFGAIGLRPPPPGREESIEDFVRRNLGDEVFERLIEPFCSGVYAGDPAKLSMRAAFGKVWKLEQNGGSIIGGTFKAIQERIRSPKPLRDSRLPKPKGQTVGSFRKGLAMLPDAISKRLGDKVKVSWKLCSIKKLDNGGYALSYDTPEGPVSVRTKSVVLTVPSHVASSLLRPLSIAAADALSKFYYPPVAAVSLSYPKEAIRSECLINGDLKGFGQLHPRSQGVETLGTIYSSSLFPNRAPPGRVLLLNYIGGATNTGILSKTEGELVETVDRDLRQILLNPNVKDPLVLGLRVWPKAIPQFLIGHLDLLETAKNSLRDGGFEGLFLGGNYVSGVALGRCVEGAYESATEALNVEKGFQTYFNIPCQCIVFYAANSIHFQLQFFLSSISSL